MDKKQTRQRRAKRTRAKIKELGVARLTVHRTSRHIYAQVINSDAKIVASASTVLPDVRSAVGSTSNVDAAIAVGKMIAERTKEAGVERVAFDRSGFKYHGRIKALADAAREHGLDF
jgi:large subunit ribosomal protein L18